MAAAATLERPPFTTEQQGLHAIAVPEMELDAAVRMRAAQFIGAAVLGNGGSAELCSIEAPIESLHDALRRAAEGDTTSRRLVATNVGTDVIERTIKTGHVMNKTPLVITKEGKIVQHGQTMDSIQANSLRVASNHPVMRARTEAEARNGFRIESLNRQGLLNDHSFVVLSRAENLPQFGFFTETMSVSIQVTTKHGTGLALESAFVAGVAADGAAPHDEATITRLGEMLGVDLSGKTAAEIIDTPLLIHNSLLPNGAIDLVRLYDQAAGGTFFGENRPPEDYLQYLEFCHQREQLFSPRIQQITNELIASAREVDSPLTAIRLLHDISEKHMVKQAIVDNSIDSRVFGRVSSMHIEQARQALERGDAEGVLQHGNEAIKTAESSSCPSASEKPADDTGDCEFISKKCPLCDRTNVKTKVRKIGRHTKRISGSCGCSTIAST
jgi:hypothetical protein